MKIILNSNKPAPTFEAALRELTEGATHMAIAVSYVQISGWEFFRKCTNGIAPRNMRLVCTDQMAITQPEAIRRAQSAGAIVRRFSGDLTFHPKVFLAYGSKDVARRFLIGSANLSYSALTSSVEAGVLGDDKSGLCTLDHWFSDLFEKRAEAFTKQSLEELELRWRKAAVLRARQRSSVQRGRVLPPSAVSQFPAEDWEVADDVLSTIQLPIGLLNMDYAGNNVRSIRQVRRLLADKAMVLGSPAGKYSKQRSELKLLGFARDGQLTELGEASLRVGSDQELAELWCRWLRQTPPNELEAFNSRLLVAKRVFDQFWNLNDKVRQFFLTNVESGTDRSVLQTIELLCNAKDLVQEFSLDEFRALAPVLSNGTHLPAELGHNVRDYFDNKGVRGWDSADRVTVPTAWMASNR